MGARSWLAAPLLPAWAAVTALHPRLRRDLGERWGVSVPPVQPGAVWIHASSVGEVGAAGALLGHLRPPVLLTADTDTGAARARALASGRSDAVAGARPVDHPLTLAPLWAEARPVAVVLVEGVWWPGLVGLARRAGVPVIRVSARAGPRTRRVPAAVYRRLTSGVTLVLARDEREAAWFRAHGDAPVEVAGDLKLHEPPAAALCWSRPFVVGASTRPGDEARLLGAIPPGHQLLLAPRHPERHAEVEELLRRSGLRWARRTTLAGAVPADLDVVLLDTLGELAAAQIGARAAFVGGTFDRRIGGHSPAEAASAGIAVVAGPHRQANRAAFEAATVVAAEDSAASLAEALARAVTLRPPAQRTDVERIARRIEAEIRGPAPESSPRPWAAPLVPLVGLATRRSRVSPPVPVVAVGSRNARGPGKTSTARWVAARLRERGHTVGVVAHGVGRPGGRRSLRLSWQGPLAELGDEAALHARDGHLVISGRDRAAAVRILADHGATVVVLDDALHDRTLDHALRIEVVDARFPTGRGLMPAGEGRHRCAPADVVVAHHVSLAFPAPDGAVVAVRVLGRWRVGFGPPHDRGPDAPVVLFAGLARPADAAVGLGVALAERIALSDHAPVGDRQAAELLARAAGRPLVCTEKDLVRLPIRLAERVWWRPLRLALDGFPEDRLP